MVKLIKESWLKDFDTFLNTYERDRVRNALLKSAVDIENEDFEEEHFSSSRDPRLRDYLNNGGFLVIKIQDGRKEDMAVIHNGKYIIDPYLTSCGWKNASKCAMRDVLANATEIYALKPSKQRDIMDLRDQRKLAKQGTVDRYVQGKGIIGGDSKYRDNSYGYYDSKYDKSGYRLNPNKYKDMLAELGVSNAMSILNQAKDVYVEIANKIYDIDFEADRDNYGFDNYESLMNRLISNFRDLDYYYKKYINETAKYPNGDSYYKGQVQSTIKDIQENLRKAKRYL